jgi:hypothetical protein
MTNLVIGESILGHRGSDSSKLPRRTSRQTLASAPTYPLNLLKEPLGIEMKHG